MDNLLKMGNKELTQLEAKQQLYEKRYTQKEAQSTCFHQPPCSYHQPVRQGHPASHPMMFIGFRFYIQHIIVVLWNAPA